MGIGEVGEMLRRSTVHVRGGGRRSQTSGSGVIWDPRGTVITNAHVLGSSDPIVELWDGRTLPAHVESRDDHRDLAKLKIAVSPLPAATFRIAKVKPGEFVIAVGNPLGFTGALTTGIVQAAGPFPGLGRRTWVQAAIRLAPGNSGGPLADAAGQVAGINTMMISGGIALAIPSATVEAFLRTGPAPRLGVTVRTVRLNRRMRFGLVILGVDSGGLAAQASLMRGDVLIGTDSARFTAPCDLADAIAENYSERLTLCFLRGDRTRERQVVVPLAGQFSREAA